MNSLYQAAIIKYTGEAINEAAEAAVDSALEYVSTATPIEVNNKDHYISHSFVYEFVEVLPEKIFFPNAFSPNDDGHNDFFFIPNGGFEEVEIYIFNRWGNQIYFSADPNFRWDGRYKGQSVPEGVYVYVIEGIGENNLKYPKRGTVTVFR